MKIFSLPDALCLRHVCSYIIGYMRNVSVLWRRGVTKCRRVHEKESETKTTCISLTYKPSGMIQSKGVSFLFTKVIYWLASVVYFWERWVVIYVWTDGILLILLPNDELSQTRHAAPVLSLDLWKSATSLWCLITLRYSTKNDRSS